MTDAQKLVANYIVEKPEKFALSSIRELEKELKTSKSTIVRLAQKLGYDGFYQLKISFLKNIRKDLHPIASYKILLSNSIIKKSDYLNMIAEETVNNINFTLQLIDKEQFQKAIGLLENANHVYTVGAGLSSYLADISSYLLKRVAIQTSSMSSCSLSFAEQVINLKKDDVILAFSFPSYTQETIKAAQFAHEKKIKVISVTDKLTNEIVQYSDAYLQVVVDSITMSNSIMSVLVLMYAIASQTGRDFKAQTLQTIESIEHLREKPQ